MLLIASLKLNALVFYAFPIRVAISGKQTSSGCSTYRSSFNLAANGGVNGIPSYHFRACDHHRNPLQCNRQMIDADIAFEPGLFEPKSPLRGNGIFRAETKRPKRPWRFKDAGAETKISLGNPADLGLIAGFRTACQARSRYRTGLSRVIRNMFGYDFRKGQVIIPCSLGAEIAAAAHFPLFLFRPIGTDNNMDLGP